MFTAHHFRVFFRSLCTLSPDNTTGALRKVKLKVQRSMGSWWQKGMIDDVCFTACVPATTAVANTGPFFTDWISCMPVMLLKDARGACFDFRRAFGSAADERIYLTTKGGSATEEHAVAVRCVGFFVETLTIVGSPV